MLGVLTLLVHIPTYTLLGTSSAPLSFAEYSRRVSANLVRVRVWVGVGVGRRRRIRVRLRLKIGVGLGLGFGLEARLGGPHAAHVRVILGDWQRVLVFEPDLA